MSLIIPITDEGRFHNIALWGGITLVPEADKQAYLESVDKFERICDKYHVDGEITNHPVTDNTLERLDVVRNIVNGVPNPFIIGEEAYHRYEDKFRQMCLKAMAND